MGASRGDFNLTFIVACSATKKPHITERLVLKALGKEKIVTESINKSRLLENTESDLGVKLNKTVSTQNYYLE